MFERQPVLAHTLSAGGRDGADAARRIVLTSVHGWHLGLIASFASTQAQIAAALRAPLGFEPALAPRDAQAVKGGHLFNTAPGQYWLATTNHELFAAVAAAIPTEHGSFTDLSHSRVRVAISGADTARVLAKGLTVDLHPEAFRVGQFAQAGLHHSGVMLHRVLNDRYELYLPRTFAVSLFEWLSDAAWPLGYDVATEDLASSH